MFDNVPNWLTEKVRGLAGTLGTAERETIYLNAAGWVIACYLGIDVSSRDAPPFFDNRTVDALGTLWHGTTNRVIHVAESLFLLRSCPGFPEFCRRMKEGSDLRSHFLELNEARRFFKAGYLIDARRETGVKGDDFDFIAVRDGETINVEVTAFTAQEFADNTVLNALNRKRQQVPDTAPAVIVGIFPERWLSDGTGSSGKLADAANKFFRGTKRINVVVFASEVHIALEGNAGALIFWHQAHENPHARIKMRDSSFLFSGRKVSVRATSVLVQGEESMADLQGESYDSEFFHWVDYLVSPP